MHYEVEQKFHLDDPGAFLARLESLGCKLAGPIVQVDQYFAHPARSFAQTDEALRIRSVGERNFVTYKGPKLDDTTKTRRELEIPIESGLVGAAQFAELLESLGFTRVAAVAKSRRRGLIARGQHEVEVVLDDVDAVGTFCELELSVDEPRVEEARQILATLAADLQLTANERRSYLEMLLAGQPARSPEKTG